AASAAATFAYWMAQSRPDLVHFHFVRAYSALVAAARAAGASIVLHDHITLGQPCDPATRPRGPLTKLAIKGYKWIRASALNRLVTTRIAVSGFVADSVFASEFVPRERIVVNANGIDVSRFVNADRERVRSELGAQNAPLVVCPSRMFPEKGVDVLIRALQLIGSDVHLAIVGNGPDQSKCETLARSIGAADRVHFLGLRDDMECVLAAADVTVVPSLWDEAFGLVVIEAMAAGSPVVVTDSGAMPEIVQHGKCGLVVPKGDVSALAHAINQLITDTTLANDIRAAAHRRVTDMYRLGSWVDRNLHVYRTVLRSSLNSRSGCSREARPPDSRSAARMSR
ncbi:MAG: hypothetical protein JWM53_5327, partial [bacterium]|nr:hypothetical protein [bacterium]